jgi:hypothetical protein
MTIATTFPPPPWIIVVSGDGFYYALNGRTG